jgi:thiol-disulfide isomerase/thioredoxin
VKSPLLAAAAAVAVIALLAGCASDPLADQYREGTTKNYISGDGSYEELVPAGRADPVEFSGVTEDDDTVSNDDFAGEIVVVNFWYAGCPPCRAEAPDLESLSTQYAADGVSFLGVNISDQPATAKRFAEENGVTYPSIMDVSDSSVQLAFTALATPNTFVLDREGRIAARFSGRIEKSVLASMIDRVLEEK